MDRIITRHIESEDPVHHWGFLDVKDKVVLDLGCGINSEFMPTPWYFLQEKKAAKVFGVDSNPQSYNWFKQNFNVKHFIPYMDMVDRFEKIEMYFDYFKPEVVKMDIEGAEINLISVKKELFEPIKQIAIEYHNMTCLIGIESVLKDLEYNIEYFKFEHIDLDHQGVIYGYK